MLQFIKKNWAPFLISFISVLVFILNYKKGVFITGWDTLHPEFDFPLNFKRLINGVWRYEQGLGAIAGHSHMADLPRVFILWIFSFFAPLNVLRYLYLFITYLFGGLGIYYLIKYLFKENKNSFIIAFISSLFYLLNLITLQTYFVPFEMFPTQFAVLPWIILYSLKYLQERGKKILILFSIITLFSTPQAYAAHLWYAFFGVYILFLLTYIFIQKNKAENVKKSIILVLLTLAINSFWLLPNLYFIKTSSNIPKESKQNRIFSQEYTLRNRDFGNIKDLALGKGFYFNWNIYDFKNNKFVNLMEDWNKHIDNISVQLIGYFLFLISIFGFLLSFKYKDKTVLSFLPFFIIPFTLLLNNTFPFNKFFDFLIGFDLFKEALRFVFNKFAVLFLFSSIVFFAYFLNYLFKKNVSKFLKNSLLIIILLCLLFSTSPIFKRKLISEKVKISIPVEYFDFWKYMKTQKQGTVLSLPIYNFPGWEYYNWGYQGAGFIWFGLNQPILNRDFDRWSVVNEQAFREFHYSIYSRNKEYLKSTLRKFNIKYIVWDKNIISPSLKNRNQIIYKNEIKRLLDDLLSDKFIKKAIVIGNIEIYELQSKNIQSIGYINSSVYPNYKWSNFDYAYLNQNNYVSQKSGLNNVFYPFRDIINTSERINKDVFEIDENNKTYSVKLSDITKVIKVPDILTKEKVFYSDLYISKLSNTEYKLILKPLLFKGLNDNYEAKIQIAQNKDPISLDFNGNIFNFNRESLILGDLTYLGQVFINTKQDNFANNDKISLQQINASKGLADNILVSKFTYKSISISPKIIYMNNKQRPNIRYIKNGDFITIESRKTYSGFNIDLNFLPHNLGYLLIIKSSNLSGLPLRLCVKNIYSNLCSVYDELSKFNSFNDDVFVIPPSDDGIGYSISFNNISYANFKTKNAIKNISLIPIPYNYLASLYSETENSIREKVLRLNQTYHDGWNAYINNKKIENHILVNNWANGWILDDTKGDIKIVFWPQYLEYLGFFLVLLAFIWILFRKD